MSEPTVGTPVILGGTTTTGERILAFPGPPGPAGSNGAPGPAGPEGPPGPSSASPAVTGYNITGSSLRKFRAALARARNNEADCIVQCIGDSITYGQGAVPGVSSYPSRLATLTDASIAGVPVVSGFVHLILGNDSRITPGVWQGLSPHGWQDSSAHNNATANAELSVSLPAGDQVKVYFAKKAGWGTGEIIVDANAPVTYSCNDPSDTFIPASQTITGLANTEHTVKFRATTADYINVLAVESLSSSTKRVTLDVAARGGVNTADVNRNDTATASRRMLTDIRPPHLAIIGLGTNDYTQQRAVATMKADYGSLIDALRTAGSDVLILVPIPTDDDNRTIPWVNYTTALYELADEKDVALLDLTKRWGTRATSEVFYSDLFHPTPLGYWEIAAAVNGVLRIA